jgi:hypothetical protein
MALLVASVYNIFTIQFASFNKKNSKQNIMTCRKLGIESSILNEGIEFD